MKKKEVLQVLLDNLHRHQDICPLCHGKDVHGVSGRDNSVCALRGLWFKDEAESSKIYAKVLAYLRDQRDQEDLNSNFCTIVPGLWINSMIDDITKMAETDVGDGK